WSEAFVQKIQFIQYASITVVKIACIVQVERLLVEEVVRMTHRLTGFKNAIYIDAIFLIAISSNGHVLPKPIIISVWGDHLFAHSTFCEGKCQLTGAEQLYPVSGCSRSCLVDNGSDSGCWTGLHPKTNGEIPVFTKTQIRIAYL